MSQIIGNKLYKVEGDALSEWSHNLLERIRVAMENLDFCSKCKSFDGEIRLHFGDIIVKIDLKNQKINLEKSD